MANPTRTPAERAAIFKALHARPGIFAIPNPFDVGTARLLAALGFEALATTSAGHAFTLGKGDNTLSRDETLDHARAIVEATELPVSADLGNCFGDEPDVVAETIRLAAETGLAGCSVEDATNRDGKAVYDLAHAVDRVRAAADAARRIGRPFVLTARAENFVVGRPDLADTIARLQAFQEAGADVLFAPGLTTIEEVKTVVRAVDRPVNVLAGVVGAHFTMDALAAAGVRRVSTGSALSRAARAAFISAARDIRERGSFEWVDAAIRNSQ